MAATSTIPAALDALLAAARAGVGAGVHVVDGPPVEWDPIALPAQAGAGGDELRYLFVGASPDGPGVAGEQDYAAAGAVASDENYRISCVIHVTGALDVKARRDEAFAVLADLEQTLKFDPSLGGAVLYARVGGIAAVTPRTGNGEWSSCTVEFDVPVRSYLS